MMVPVGYSRVFFGMTNGSRGLPHKVTPLLMTVSLSEMTQLSEASCPTTASCIRMQFFR